MMLPPLENGLLIDNSIDGVVQGITFFMFYKVENILVENIVIIFFLFDS
jgi:hypothetical protein